jgi:hypothetical protein
MRIYEIIKEAATTTSSGNFAVVVNPPTAYSKDKSKKPKPNALDKNDNLFGGGSIRRNNLKFLALSVKPK